MIGIAFSFFNGTHKEVSNVIVNSGMSSLNVFIKLALLMLFWNGLFEIAKDAMVTKSISKLFKRPLSYIFKTVDKDSVCMEYIASNVVSNLLGLGACATPLGFKVMELLQENNVNKNVPSRDMIKFILINISTLSVIPTTIISLRESFNSNCDITFLCMIVSIFSFTITLIIESIINLILKVKL